LHRKTAESSLCLPVPLPFAAAAIGCDPHPPSGQQGIDDLAYFGLDLGDRPVGLNQLDATRLLPSQRQISRADPLLEF